jgi:hypothetical protein
MNTLVLEIVAFSSKSRHGCQNVLGQGEEDSKEEGPERREWPFPKPNLSPDLRLDCRVLCKDCFPALQIPKIVTVLLSHRKVQVALC